MGKRNAFHMRVNTSKNIYSSVFEVLSVTGNKPVILLSAQGEGGLNLYDLPLRTTRMGRLRNFPISRFLNTSNRMYRKGQI